MPPTRHRLLGAGVALATGETLWRDLVDRGRVSTAARGETLVVGQARDTGGRIHAPDRTSYEAR